MNDLGTFSDLGSAFQAAARRVLETGTANAGRSNGNREIRVVAYEITAPRARIIDIDERRTNAAFLLAECLWHLAGRDDVAMLSHYAPSIGRYSADGTRFTGSAYGRRLFAPMPGPAESQWNHMLGCLREDSGSRRAILVLADAGEVRLTRNKDVTCTTSLHFLIREGTLDLITTMRSNDVMRGMQSDVFLFTMLQEIAATELGLPLGSYTHVTNLAQIYEPDMAWARECVEGRLRSAGTMLALPDQDVWDRLGQLIEAEASSRAGRRSPRIEGTLGAWQSVLAAFEPGRPGSRDHLPLLDPR
jgi:thymidylate synthase